MERNNRQRRKIGLSILDFMLTSAVLVNIG
jgi:hypothetical protein